MLKVLQALKDIPGVVGSFVLSDAGALACREMPAVYPDEMFPELGRRLAGVQEAVKTVSAPFADLLLKFDAYWLLTRRAPNCTLNILTTQSVNYPALRMATNVALKQIAEQYAPGEEPQATKPAVANGTGELKQRRFFRGQPVNS